jgi:predicted dehydrogenase
VTPTSLGAAVAPFGSRPRLGFLGVGWIGRHRMEAVAASGLADVAVIADPVEAAAREAASAAPRAMIAASLDDLLAHALDGVVIATPSALHAEQSVRALERGLAVFCQKPLGRTAAEVRRTVDAARAADRLLAVDLSYRHVAGVPQLRQLVRGGAIGRVHAVNLVFHNAYGPDKPWFYDVAQSGGGCVMDLGIHLVDLALWTLGFPAVAAVTSAVSAQGTPLRGRIRCEDHAAALIRLEGGAAVQLACSWRLAAGQDCAIEAAFYGTEGGLALRNVNGSFYDFVVERYRGTQREVLAAPPDAWGGRAAVAFAQALASGARFDPEVEGLVRVAEVLDAIYAGTAG